MELDVCSFALLNSLSSLVEEWETYYTELHFFTEISESDHVHWMESTKDNSTGAQCVTLQIKTGKRKVKRCQFGAAKRFNAQQFRTVC